MKTTLQLLLLIVISFVILWFDKKLTSLDKSFEEPVKRNDNQVILLLVDALREDFVEMESEKKVLKRSSSYTHKKINLFQDLQE